MDYHATPEQRADHYKAELRQIEAALSAIPAFAIDECRKLQTRRYGVELGLLLAEADIREDDALVQLLLTGKESPC